MVITTMTSITTIFINIVDLLQFSLLRPNRLLKHADLRFDLYQLRLKPSAIKMLHFTLFAFLKTWIFQNFGDWFIYFYKKILLLLGQLDLDQILDLFCFSFLYACNVLDCKIQREIRLNPSFDITLDSLSFFYHDKISSSFDEFHGNITVSWKLPTVTYCRNERYHKVRNLTDQVDKKDEKFTKLINKNKTKNQKGRKSCTWWSRRLFCSACVRTRTFLSSLQAKKPSWFKKTRWRQKLLDRIW